ncbi:MAG TPA: AI-2E family transporter [Clostridium sp.]
MELEKKTINRIIGLLALLIVLYFGFNHWMDIIGILQRGYELIFPFILGGCIAFILNIPMTFFNKKLSNVKGKKIGALIRKGDTVISLVMSIIMIIGIVVLTAYIVMPQIIDTAGVLPQTFENSMVEFNKWITSNSVLSSNIINWINNIQISWDSILNSVINNVKSRVFNGAGSMLLTTIGMATTFASAIVDFILGFVFAIYILLQKKKLGIQCKKILYAFLNREKADSILEVVELTSKTFSNFITGQCLESFILGIMFFITMTIFNFPYALVGSVIIACTSIVPLLGSIMGCVLVEFLIVMINPGKAVMFLIVYIVIKQLEDNLIYPRIVGNSVGLPSVWVLFTITVGGKLMGIAGMIIFIPLFSVAYVLFRKMIYRKLKKNGIEI